VANAISCSALFRLCKRTVTTGGERLHASASFSSFCTFSSFSSWSNCSSVGFRIEDEDEDVLCLDFRRLSLSLYSRINVRIVYQNETQQKHNNMKMQIQM
jgi:hypothetical protein